MFKYVAIIKTKANPFGELIRVQEYNEQWFAEYSVEIEANISVYEVSSGKHIMTFGGIL